MKRGALGQRASCPLARTAIFAAIAALCAAALPSFASDWTDASSVTYTALKSVNGNNSAYIVTDWTPDGTEIAKFKYKSLNVTQNQFVFCSRYSSSAYNQFCAAPIKTVFRADRYNTQCSCNTTSLAANEVYSIVINFGGANQGVVTINGTAQTLSKTMSKASYTVGSVLVLFGSHIANQGVTPTSISNKFRGDLYYLQLWNADGTTLEHNFMPAVRDSDSVVGLYDTAARKFWPATGGTFTSVAYDASDRAGVKWTGAGDGVSMSDGSNWEGGVAPGDGDDIDFTIAVPNAPINANISATFGKIYLGAGDLPAFTGALTATAINDLTRIRDYADATASFTFTIAAGNYTWNGTGSNWGDTGAWTYDNAAATWADNNNAIFSTANATATLAADVEAFTLAFNADATVSGSSTLTVPTVSVASGVAATISAPTAGALEKTGTGTLTLTQNRADATTLTAGTLKMDGATVADLTLGTDGGASVVFDYGGQTLSANPETYLVTGSTVTLTNGTFSSSGAFQIRDNTKIPSVLTIAKDASLVQESGNINMLKDNGTATINVQGGTLGSVSGSGASYLQHGSDIGRLNVNVTEGGRWIYPGNVYALCNGTTGTNPSLYMMLNDSTFSVNGTFYYGNSATRPTSATGILAATNSIVFVTSGFYIGRNANDNRAGSLTADFEDCIVTARYWNYCKL